jgi:hypothetical protein
VAAQVPVAQFATTESKPVPSPHMLQMLDDVVAAVTALTDLKINLGLAKLHDEPLSLAEARASTDAELLTRINALATQVSGASKRLAALERRATNA